MTLKSKQASTLSKNTLNSIKIDLRSTRFPWFLATLVYIISYGFCFLFLDAYFWDDWFSKSLSASDEKLSWRAQGFPPWDFFVPIDLLERNPVMIRLVTLLSFFACGWFVFQILRKVSFLTTTDCRLVALFFLVMPINSARVALDNFHYSFSLFIFYFAWYLLVTGKRAITKALSVPLFFFSFSTLSFLVFLAAPALHFFALNCSSYSRNQIRRYFGPLSLLLMAPIYWLYTKTVFPPSSDLTEYYKPQISGILRGFLLISITTALSIWAIRRHGISTPSRNVKVMVGLQLIALGSFPYITSGRLVDISEWMINFVPRLSDWESRHQLLLGLGLSLIIVGLFSSADSITSKQGVKLIMFSCVTLNFTFMHSYWLDYRKQTEIIEIMAESYVVAEGKVIMFNDLALNYNARGRRYRWYEWHGMLQRSFGDSKRSVADFEYLDCGAENLVPDVLVTINTTQGRLRSTISNSLGIQINAVKINPCN